MKDLNVYTRIDSGRPVNHDTCHVGALPEAMEAHLKDLPQNLFLKLHGLEQAVNTYIAWQEGKPAAIIFFTVTRAKVDVINHIARIGCEEVARFCRYIFENLENVDVICMKAVHSNVAPATFSFPVQRFNSTETYLIALPDTPEQFDMALGKATRRNIRYYSNKLMRDFPSFRHTVYINEDIQEAHVRDILKLRELRFEAKKVYYRDSEESIQRVIRLAKACGLVTVMTIEGRICAGTINFRAGTYFQGHVLTQAPEYKDYMLGMIAARKAVSEAIQMGGKCFELGSGRLEYKIRLNGVRIDMDRLDIYRSSFKKWRHVDHAAKASMAGHIRQLKLRLLQREKSLLTRTAIALLYRYLKIRDQAG
jgi:hypothetical protein